METIRNKMFAKRYIAILMSIQCKARGYKIYILLGIFSKVLTTLQGLFNNIILQVVTDVVLIGK